MTELIPSRCGEAARLCSEGARARKVRERVCVCDPQVCREGEREKGERGGESVGTQRKGVAVFLSLGGQGGVCRPVVYCVDCKHQCYDTPA